MSEFAFAATTATPRKRPVQSRSRDTVDAILEATFRVLADLGPALTTTRVAELAGVSVGTLYQYFPNRDALLHGALAAHLEIAISAVERAALDARGWPRAAAAEHVVRAFLAAKAERVAASRAMHPMFGPGKLDDRPIVRAATHRAHHAVAALLSDGAAPTPAILQRAELACAALEGIVRTTIDTDPDRLRDPAWIEQVVRISVNAMA